jgi:hypothetical protein
VTVEIWEITPFFPLKIVPKVVSSTVVDAYSSATVFEVINTN